MSKKDQIVEEEVAQEPDAGPASFFPEPGPGMGKEVKIGLAVILGLLLVFGAVVVKKWRGAPESLPPVAEEPGAKPPSPPDVKFGPKEPLSGGGPAAKSPPPTSVTGKPGTADLSGGEPKWGKAPLGGLSSPKTPFGDGRNDSSPPTHMPKPGLAEHPDRFAASSNPLEKTAPPRPSDPMGSKAISSADEPFNPNPIRKPATSAFNSSDLPPMAAPASRPGSAMAGEGMARPDRPQVGGLPGSSSTSLAMRDVSNMGSGPGFRNPPPPAGTTVSSGAEQHINTLRNPPPDTSMPASPPPFNAPAPNTQRPMSEFSSPAAPMSTAGYSRSELPPPRRPIDIGGPQPAGSYRVQPNDNYWTISKRLYNTGDYFRALAQHNRNRFPDENRLTVGDVISTPSQAELERNYPTLCPKMDTRQPLPERPRISNVSSHSPGSRTYVVQEGDNLFNIAKYELNSAKRWVEIYDLNRDLLGDQVDRLKPGMQLVLPDRPAPAARTALQGSGLNR